MNLFFHLTTRLKAWEISPLPLETTQWLRKVKTALYLKSIPNWMLSSSRSRSRSRPKENPPKNCCRASGAFSAHGEKGDRIGRFVRLAVARQQHCRASSGANSEMPSDRVGFVIE